MDIAARTYEICAHGTKIGGRQVFQANVPACQKYLARDTARCETVFGSQSTTSTQPNDIGTRSDSGEWSDIPANGTTTDTTSTTTATISSSTSTSTANTDVDMSGLFEYFDADESGGIDLGEFLDQVDVDDELGENDALLESYIQLFLHHDKNSDGLITPDEVA